MTDRSGSLVVAVVLAAVAAGCQLALWVDRVDQLQGDLRITQNLLASDAVSFEPAAVAAEAHRALPGLAALLPDDARVLLVSGHPLPVQFEFYFLPRPFRLLQQLDPGVFASARARWPELAAPIREAQARMEALELGLTPERLGEALRRADYLVTFLLPPAWVDQAQRAHPELSMERIGGNAQAVAYRLVRAPTPDPPPDPLQDPRRGER